jgi:hypothetical protein
MRAGEPFEQVEEAIEVALVTDEQKSALWLMAFSMRERVEQMRDARAYLAAVADN